MRANAARNLLLDLNRSPYLSLFHPMPAFLPTLLNNLLIIVAVPFAASAAAADPSRIDKSQPASIKVSAEAIVEARADQALVEIGVVTEAESAAQAARLNAQRVSQVLQQLRVEGGPAQEIQTGSYVLAPRYDYPREGGTPRLAGYTATHLLTLKTTQLDRVGDILDLSVQAGGNRVERVQFILRDEIRARREALSKAVIRARGHAEAIAATLGQKVARVLSVEESSPPVAPLMREAAFARADTAAPTSIVPGVLEVRAIVTLIVELAP